MTQANKIYDYNALEYLFCYKCGKIKELEELEVNDNRIKCLKCGNTRLS